MSINNPLPLNRIQGMDILSKILTSKTIIIVETEAVVESQTEAGGQHAGERVSSLLSRKMKVSGYHPLIDRMLEVFEARYHLTPREAEVIGQLCLGCCDFPEVSRRLGISSKTLRNHMSSIYTKTRSTSVMGLYSVVVDYILSCHRESVV